MDKTLDLKIPIARGCTSQRLSVAYPEIKFKISGARGISAAALAGDVIPEFGCLPSSDIGCGDK